MAHILDANIIIRFFAEEAGELYEKSVEVFGELENDSMQALCPAIVLAECYFVLTKHYTKRKHDVCRFLQEFLDLPGIIEPDKIILTETLTILSHANNISFVDAYLITYARKQGHTVLTFDQGVLKYLEKHS